MWSQKDGTTHDHTEQEQVEVAVAVLAVVVEGRRVVVPA